MAIHLDRQRPPKKRMGRLQRTGSKSNPTTGVQWANWLDNPAGAPGGGGGGTPAPTLTSIAPTTAVVLTAITITATGTNLTGATLSANGTNLVTTQVSATSVTAAYTTAGAAGPVLIRAVAAGGTTAPLTLTVTAAAEDPEGNPTSSWLKGDIIQWLVDKGVVVDEEAAKHFTKPELLDIVAAFLNDDQDTVDELLGG